MVHSLSLALRGTTKANWLKEQFRNFVTLCISLIFCAINLKKKNTLKQPSIKDYTCAFVGVLLKYEIYFNLAVQFKQEMHIRTQTHATCIQFRITNRSSKKMETSGRKRRKLMICHRLVQW